MIGVLVRKLTGLGRDENGAALMVTLALFLFMYLSGAGVFAIGKVVKDRIHLQNACDAAAYSAAVVQADTLSRIATINRAMAWTYVSMTRRQMDYIVHQWLAKTLKEYEKSQDPKTDISLNGSDTVPEKKIENALTYFRSQHLSDQVDSFYSASGNLSKQIEDDRITIAKMNESVRSLKDGMLSRITDAANKILSRNVESYGMYFYFLKCSDECFEALKDEKRFTKFVGEELESYKWFESKGIFRDYGQKAGSLVSKWSGFDGPRECRGEEARDSYFTGQRAEPIILKDSYFGEAGTITVGLAKYNENPWYRILKTKTDTGGILKGIFAAFNPYRFVEWTWAFSSAKAGYKASGADNREYMIHGNTGDAWNLSVDDWDAVFVPVRRAVSMANADGEWNYSKTPLMKDWIEGSFWKPLSGSSVSYSVSNMPDLPQMDTRYGADGSLDWDKIAEMLYH